MVIDAKMRVLNCGNYERLYYCGLPVFQALWPIMKKMTYNLRIKIF